MLVITFTSTLTGRRDAVPEPSFPGGVHDVVSSTRNGSPVRSMRRHLLLSAAIAGPLAVLVAALSGGARAAPSALVGVSIVTLVVVLGFVGITAVTNGPTGLALAGAAIVYLGQLLLLVLAIAVLRDATWLEGRALSLAAIAQVLATQVGQVVGYVRGRHLIAPDAFGSAR